MTSRVRALAMSTALFLALATPALGASQEGVITDSSTYEACFAGSDGTCSASATAAPAGDFGAAAELDSVDSPLSRSTRYSMALARYTIGFDLDAPAEEIEITATLQVDEASASWTQAIPELFGGDSSDRSGAKVLFQMLGHEADGCGCGWPGQSSGNVVVVEAAEPSASDSVSDETVEVAMTARNPYGDNLLPAGHYEVLLRGYALADLVGTGDWGTLSSSMSGRIQDVTVSVGSDEDGTEASNLTLSVSGTGVNRVLTAQLTDDDAAPIDGRTISFYGDGELLGTAVTEDGTATLPVDGKFRGGNRSFSAEFAGDDTYDPSSATAGR